MRKKNEKGEKFMSSGSSTFYVTGGTLRHDAPSYVERQADKDLLEGLLKGEFCYVLTSRQMGKSSLMVRTATKLRDQGIEVVVLDLTAIGQNLTPEQWYDGLLGRMGRQLDRDEELEQFWKNHLNIGGCQRFFDSIRDIVLPALKSTARTQRTPGESSRRPSPSEKSLVIFVDEIDTVRSLPFSTDEFFAAVRECYNRRAEDAVFNQLTFCLLGVATPSDLIRNTRLTPFNIGRRIELNDFTAEESVPLARGLDPQSAAGGEGESVRAFEHQSVRASDPTGQSPPRSTLDAQRLLQRVLYWTNGHPYLTQRLCQALAASGPITGSSAVDRLCKQLFFSARARERDDNLIFVRERILRSEVDRAGLLHLYEKVLRGSSVADQETDPLVSVLRLAGLVRVVDGRLTRRNRIYARVFDRSWVRETMPDAEARRQRAAFRRGVLRATAIAAVVVAAMIVMIVIAVNQAAKARSALAQSYFSQAQARRVSGASGQRFESLKALREARRYHANEDLLRDELIACLALTDLSEKTGFYALKQTDVSELNLDLGVSATAQMNGNVTLRSLADGHLLKTLPGFGLPVRQLRFGPKEAVLLAEYRGGSQDQIVLWNWQKGQKLFELPHGIHASAVDFSADGRKLALGQNSGRVIIYALPQGQILRELELKWESGLPRTPQVLRFHPSGELLAESCLDDLNVQVWDLNLGQRALRLYHPDKVYDLAWQPNGEVLATACGDSSIYLWYTNRTDRPIKKLIGHDSAVKAIAFNHRGNLLASAGVDETLRLWIPATDRQMARRLDAETFERLQFSSKDDALIASGERPHRTRAWDISGDEYVVLQLRSGLADRLKSIDFSPDGRWLAATSGERTMIWDCSSAVETGGVHFGHTYAGSFSADSRHLLASTDGGLLTCPLTEVTNGTQSRLQLGAIQQLDQVPDELDTMALCLDRSRAMIVHQEELRLLSLVGNSNSAVRVLPVGYHYRRLALHPQALWLAAMMAGSDSIHIWNLSSNALAAPCTIAGSEFFAFSPDGKWLVICCNGKFQFYRVGAWQKPALAIPRKPESNQHAPIAFTRDGSVVALASSRYTIQLLQLTESDPPAAKVIASLESPDRGPLEILTFSPDGRRLAAGTVDLTVQLWNLALVREALAELNLDQNWPKYRRKIRD